MTTVRGNNRKDTSMDTNTHEQTNTTSSAKHDDTRIITRHGTVRVTVQPITDGD